MKPIKEMSEEEFAKFFKAVRGKIIKDPIKYFVEAPGFIDFTPTPAQTVALKCVFGQTLDADTEHQVYREIDSNGEFDLEYTAMTEVALYDYMTGFKYNPDDPIAGNRINLIVGRRGGKSTISAILALFSTFKVNWKPYLKKTPVATVAILSHSVDFSQEILDILRAMVDDSEVLTRLKDKTRKDTQSTFHLKIPFIKDDSDDIEYSSVAIKVGAASKKTTRGRAVCTLLADEIAYWQLDNSSAESDIDILRAVRPALLQFGEHGTIIKLSSPAIKQGVLYDEWTRRDQLKLDFIQFKAPSWVWNTILPAEEFKKEWRLDPDGFDVEYRSNFVDSISNFILPEHIDIATMRGVSFLTPSDDKTTTYSAAIDAAFKADNFAFSIVGHNGARVTQYVSKHWEGSRKEPVRAHDVAKYIRNMCKVYGISEVTGDQYAFQPLREIFEQYGVTLVENTFTLPYKRKIYFNLKRLIHSQQLDLLDVPMQIKELKELQVEQTTTGQIRIGHPVGGQDDLSDALAVATYRALENAGAHGIASGNIASAEHYHKVKVDRTGRAFNAPHPEMLTGYSGFTSAIDNTSEYEKDPETGKWRKKSDIEEEQSLSHSGGDFCF